MNPGNVHDKQGKANIRKGSKNAKSAVISCEPQEILPFINHIICADALRALIQHS